MQISALNLVCTFGDFYSHLPSSDELLIERGLNFTLLGFLFCIENGLQVDPAHERERETYTAPTRRSIRLSLSLSRESDLKSLSNRHR